MPNQIPSVIKDDVDLTSNSSAVSWSAIFAGSAAAASLALVLLILGTGLGLSSVSPWARSGMSAKAFGISAILWLIITQIIAHGIGGYLAGRLRTKWLAVHTKEVFFRDTAHGFLTWAIALLATAALLTTVISTIMNGGIQAGASAAEVMANTAVAATTGGGAAAESMRMRRNISNLDNANADPMTGSIGYLLDALFRKELALESSASALKQSKTADTQLPLHEVAGILLNSIQSETLPTDDLHYLGQVLALHTGLPTYDAETRVSETFVKLQENLANAEVASKFYADKARKTSANAALWIFLSMLIGALTASYAATYGGRCRDQSH
ncbi:MAG: hypothetical protein H7Z18_09295 [Methylophilaceae bacterium]|nr:hypothetical protein [Methylophilaceae bacterium]